LASPFTTSNYSFIYNTPTTVKAFGWGFSVSYRFPKGYELGVNASGDKLKDLPANFVSFFNTPKFRYNITFGNDKISGSNWGFNVLYRWQDKVYWEGTFGSAEIPSYGTLDAQVNYKFTKLRSIIKIGASNLLNHYYTSAFGNPNVGGLYYASFGYNIF
jgi:hypothetical protein